jgi:hypothetical protein
MARGTAFWVIVIVWILFAGAATFGYGREYNIGGIANLVELVLFIILGWAEFGPPIRGSN